MKYFLFSIEIYDIIILKDIKRLFAVGGHMLDRIKAILSEYKIELCAPIALSSCKLIYPHKLTNSGFSLNEELFAIMLAVPYLTPAKERNISSYAVPRDYHLYFDSLFSSLLPKLKAEFPDNMFKGFADNSPILERDAAAKAGLGIIGDNMMLITEKYSSYVFLAEIITDLPFSKEEAKIFEIKHCRGCGRCKNVCPADEIGECLSSLTQKKGILTKKEEDAIQKYGSAWGCDRCQEVCVHTKRCIDNGTIYTDIDFFNQELIPCLSSSLLEDMNDEAFSKRAYSWRKRETVKRNIDIIENNEKN